MIKVVINKFVLLPKLRKKVGQEDFSFKSCGSPHKIRMRMGQF